MCEYVTDGDIWLKRHNVSEERFDQVYSANGKLETIRDVQILLAYGIEFYVVFRGREYFLSPCPDTYQVMTGRGYCYETDDLDDFGENARIGENGEFYLKDVIDELKY